MQEITADGVLRFTESTMNLFPALFLDDMLNYVFTRFRVHRLGVTGHRRRSEYLSQASYTFSSQIGDALIRILRTFSNIAESVIVFSNLLRADEEIWETSALSSRVINLLKCHKVLSLTDADFDLNPRVWCSQMLHYLVIVSALCLYYERYGHIIESIDVMGEASRLLNRILNERASEKIESLKQYSRSTINEPPLTHTTIYELY